MSDSTYVDVEIYRIAHRYADLKDQVTALEILAKRMEKNFHAAKRYERLVPLVERLFEDFHVEPRDGNPDTLMSFQNECEAALKGGAR
jgi:hypothetical protein